MKIIQNNYTKENKVSEEYICEECNSVFEQNVLIVLVVIIVVLFILLRQKII